jgi:hypothetical protein
MTTERSAVTAKMIAYALKSGVSESEFLAASDGLLPELATLEGFIRRELLKGEDGRWLDVVYWQTRENADRSEDTIQSLPACARCIAMMDFESLTVSHLTAAQPIDGARGAVARYYDAWQNKRGDFEEVPLAENFHFVGPVASFDDAEGYRVMARQAGQAVTSFKVRRQFVDGSLVCSIIDWEMAIPGTGRMTSAEILEVKDGVIVGGELIYDAEVLRRAMAPAGG